MKPRYQSTLIIREYANSRRRIPSLNQLGDLLRSSWRKQRNDPLCQEIVLSVCDYHSPLFSCVIGVERSC